MLPPVFICPKTTTPSWVSCTCAARTLPPQKLATSIKAPANPYLIHDFIVLLPSLWPLVTPVASSPLVSGQKIAGICEGKMRLCEAKVKSGDVRRNQQRTTTKMTVGCAVNKSSQDSPHAITALM